MGEQNGIHGLTQQQAEKRLAVDGRNEVPEYGFRLSEAILTRLWEPSAWILEVALILEILLGKYIQAGFIILMLLFAAGNGAVQSGRSYSVLGKLSKELVPMAYVQRSGNWTRVSSTVLVVDDLIGLQRGDIIPADARICSGSLEVDESTITGEASAIHKMTASCVFSGTQVIAGDAEAIVTATGINSRSGKTITLVNRSSAQGHLQKLMGRIIGYLAVLDAGLVITLVVVSLLRGEDLITILPFLAMLFIATIPIAMPSSFSVANAVEAKELSKRGILASNLTGIQEAANMDLLLIDKTGTLTDTTSKVVNFINLSQQFDDNLVISYAMSAANQRGMDTLDAAIVRYGRSIGLNSPRQFEFFPFDSSLGYSSARVGYRNQLIQVKLGSYRTLKHFASSDQFSLLESLQNSANTMVAVCIADELVGIFVLENRIRPDSRSTISEIRRRGVKVLMITGDNRAAASAVAHAVGLQGNIISFCDFTSDKVDEKLVGICDVTPENKLSVTKSFQSMGYVVGMTGDGVNDAPSLKQADVGIAVSNAVDFAKRSADMVLLKGGLKSIIEILDSGHRVYRRMMTWTITKLSRTAELTMLLTFGYIFLGFTPLSLNAMVLVAILNDLVTMVLGTDNTAITYKPENWTFTKLAAQAGFYRLAGPP